MGLNGYCPRLETGRQDPGLRGKDCVLRDVSDGKRSYARCGATLGVGEQVWPSWIFHFGYDIDMRVKSCTKNIAG